MWWQIVLILIGFVICWFAGASHGYQTGWLARGVAEDEKFIERAQRACRGREK